MAFENYVALKATLLDWLVRPDLAAVVGTFVELFEAQANRALRTRWQELTVPNFVLSGQTVSVPADHVGTRSLALATTPPQPLRFVTPQQFDEMPLSSGSAPRVFTMAGNYYVISPTPSAGTTARLVYWRKLPPLAIANTNWLLSNYPDAYLYGSLMHAAPYLNNDERLPTWIDLAGRAMASVVADDNAAKYSGPLTMRSDIVPCDEGTMAY